MLLSPCHFKRILVWILVRPGPACGPGLRKELSMNKLTSCEFNIDTACVELRYAGGSGINIYCPGVEDSFDTTLSMRTEMDWLIYNATLEYARMVLDGTLDGYLREASDVHSLED